MFATRDLVQFIQQFFVSLLLSSWMLDHNKPWVKNAKERMGRKIVSNFIAKSPLIGSRNGYKKAPAFAKTFSINFHFAKFAMNCIVCTVYSIHISGRAKGRHAGRPITSVSTWKCGKWKRIWTATTTDAADAAAVYMPLQFGHIKKMCINIFAIAWIEKCK